MITLDSNDNSIIKLNTNLLKKAPVRHSLTGPTGQIYSAREKVELFADIFQNQFSPNSGLDTPEVKASVQAIRQT